VSLSLTSIGPASSVELPVPEKQYREQGMGSRTTFFRWEQMGLPVLKVGGRRFIKPSALAAFLERIGTPAVVQSSREGDATPGMGVN